MDRRRSTTHTHKTKERAPLKTRDWENIEETTVALQSHFKILKMIILYTVSGNDILNEIIVVLFRSPSKWK
jgi:hypothetical protein